MLEILVYPSIFLGMVNAGILICSVKWKVWQYFKKNPCFFCAAFWLTIPEFVFIYPTLWPYAVSVALASGSLTSLLLSDI
jgi:hypothetical protein